MYTYHLSCIIRNFFKTWFSKKELYFITYFSSLLYPNSILLLIFWHLKYFHNKYCVFVRESIPSIITGSMSLYAWCLFPRRYSAMCVHASNTRWITRFPKIKTTFVPNEIWEISWFLPTSLHTSMVPNTTWRPSKKLSPIMMTMAPPVVQPSLGLMALMQGVAKETREKISSALWWSKCAVFGDSVGHSKKFNLSFVHLPSFPNCLLFFSRSLRLN